MPGPLQPPLFWVLERCLARRLSRASGEIAWGELSQYKEFWGPDDDKIIIASWVDEGDFLTQERLVALDDLTRELEDLGAVQEVTSLPAVIRMQSGEDDSLSLASVLDTFPTGASGAGLADWKAELLNDALLVPALVSEDAKATTILVQFTESSSNMEKVYPWLPPSER